MGLMSLEGDKESVGWETVRCGKEAMLMPISVYMELLEVWKASNFKIERRMNIIRLFQY